jgi:CTP:molybdopterin cytidylyltransferase MocA
MLAAILLAAGDSKRMGTPKALLPDPDGRPFVARLVRSFSAAGIDEIVVVTGATPEAWNRLPGNVASSGLGGRVNTDQARVVLSKGGAQAHDPRTTQGK